MVESTEKLRADGHKAVNGIMETVTDLWNQSVDNNMNLLEIHNGYKSALILLVEKFDCSTFFVSNDAVDRVSEIAGKKKVGLSIVPVDGGMEIRINFKDVEEKNENSKSNKS